MKTIQSFALFCLMTLSMQIHAGHDITSPDEKLTVAFTLQNGQPIYTLAFNNTEMIKPSALGLNLKNPFSGGFELVEVKEGSVDNEWTPLWGEYDVIPDQHNSLRAVLKEQGPAGRTLIIEFRAYNEGLAFRYHMPNAEKDEWKVLSERTTFHFPEGSAACPVYWTSGEYPREPVPLDNINRMAMIPFTVRQPDGSFASLFEAHVVSYPRCGMKSKGNSAVGVEFLANSVVGEGKLTTPWRVVLVGEDEGKLIENEHLILTLNPPCAIKNPDWIKPGLTMSNNRNCDQMTQDCMKEIIDLASEQNFRYLQLDWAWYGTEWKWSQADRKEFLAHSPDYEEKYENFDEIIAADPYTVVKGAVPYRPAQKWAYLSRYVDFEMDELVRYAKKRNMGVCLYIHDRVLRKHDLDKLFSHYEDWGIAGLKPGFVGYGSAADTDWIRHMVKTAAKHHLWLCIHDDHVPDGMERTYPNLFISEGTGGQEMYHDVHQDVILPFTRNLAGPFDYTPRLNNNEGFKSKGVTYGKSHLHGVAFFVVYPGPTAIVRGHVREIIDDTPAAMGVEAEFVKRLPMNWDDTKVLDAKMGEYIVIARRNDKTWFIAGMTGHEAYTAPLELDFLKPGRQYTATIYRDSKKTVNDFRHAVKETRTVNAGDKLNIRMAKAGGLAVIIE
mgnify:CR=1 FL=1